MATTNKSMRLANILFIAVKHDRLFIYVVPYWSLILTKFYCISLAQSQIVFFQWQGAIIRGAHLSICRNTFPSIFNVLFLGRSKSLAHITCSHSLHKSQKSTLIAETRWRYRVGSFKCSAWNLKHATLSRFRLIFSFRCCSDDQLHESWP